MRETVWELSDGSTCRIAPEISLDAVRADLRRRGLEVKQVLEDKLLADERPRPWGEGSTMASGNSDTATLVKVGMEAVRTDLTAHRRETDAVLGGLLQRERARERQATPWTSPHAAAFLRWLTTAVKTGDPDRAIRALGGTEQKALSEGSDPGGGFAVPPEMATPIAAQLGQVSVFRRYADVRPCRSDVLVLRRFARATSDGSVYASDFQGAWVGEVPTPADTDPAFVQVHIPIRKRMATTRLSRDLADDVPELLDALGRQGGTDLAIAEDLAFAGGVGALQPEGLLSAGLTTVDVEGTTANTISNSAADAGSAPKLLTLVAALPDQYQARARWLLRTATESSIRQLVNAQGGYLWPYTDARGPGGERLLMGWPLHANAGVAAEGTDGAQVVIFGDLGSGYVVADRGQLSLRILRERYMDTDQLGVILVDRVGGAVANPDAFRVGVV